MFCIHCGAKLAENSKFCPLCGNAAAPAVPPVPQPAVQPAAQPVYGAPVYSYPVYVMPAAPVQPAQTVPAQPAAAPYAAPVSAADGVPAYRQSARPAQPACRQPAPETAAAAAPAAEGIPKAAAETETVVPEPQPEDISAPLSVWQTVVCLLALFCLPIGNILFACVWGFRENEHPQRRTLARAALPFIAAGLIALFCGLLWLVLNMNSISVTIR